MKRTPRQRLITLSFCVLCASTDAQVITTKRVASGLTAPLFGTAPPADFNRLFIVEQGSGTSANIKILNLTTLVVEETPFLTLTNISTGGERGLLGLAFHPDYALNGRFYVNYTDASGNLQIRQYNVSANPDLADDGSALAILSIAHPNFPNHNGGWIGFGPDNYLYIATGDGGFGNDPGNHAQNISDGSLLGKMLRIDVNSDDFPADDARNYAIPATNPFKDVPGDDEIWAYGLRNPWRNSFDRLTGDLYIADVGQGAVEEVNFQSANSTGGMNYGWRPKEGSIPNPNLSDPIPPNAVDPIHEYSHFAPPPDGGTVITGGYVYRGTRRPDLQGHYFFADYASDQIWSFKVVGGVKTEFRNRTTDFTTDVGTLTSISSFGEDARGELYIISHAGDVFAVMGGGIESAVSVGQHGSEGAIHIALTFDGQVASDPRLTVNQIRVIFAIPVRPSAGDLAPETIVVSSSSGASVPTYEASFAEGGNVGRELTLLFSQPLPDQHRYRISFEQFVDAAGNPLSGNVRLDFGVLQGDANNDAVVTATDVSFVRSRINQAAAFGPTARADLNMSGTVTGPDVSFVRSRIGHFIP